MKAIKKGADLIFTCDDGKTVKYISKVIYKL